MSNLFKSDSVFYYDQIMANPATTLRIMNGEKTIITGIYRDDFHIGIQNQWQTGGSSMMKMGVDIAASFINSRDIKFGAKIGQTLGDSIVKGNSDENGKALPGSEGIVKFGQNVISVFSDVSKLSNSHIMTADDYFKSFKGTTVTFPTNLSVTLISDELITSDKGERIGRDVYDTIRTLLSISIGDFSNPSALMHYVGIQAPPNGFNSTFLNLDAPIEGAVSVIFGDQNNGGYTVSNLVVSNVMLNFSKAKVEVGTGIFRPLYIDVQVMFEPAKMMNRNDLINVFDKNSGLK